ncbi:hypothetical protein [Priestia megaterium]|uniref:hypothetical protein n=1 Tax=Priestia megaterium TaxID=1404 RepID=UPI00366BED55
MNYQNEQFFFKREMTRLQEEYERCNNSIIKHEIKQDICLLKTVVDRDYTYYK